MAKMIFGCGYLGRRVGQYWLERDDRVIAVTRREATCRELREEGYEAWRADITEPATLESLPAVDTVLFAVGYDRSSQASIEQVYVDGLQHVLDRLPPSVRKFIYISSTGVYGQTNGEWVDEDSPCQPATKGGAACLAAETLLTSGRWSPQSIVLRLAGIYGPDRVPRRTALETGEPIAAPGEGYMNLIHVEDAARVVIAAEDHLDPPQRLLVADGHPVIRRDYFQTMSELLNVSPPQFVDGELSPRAATNKRVDNSRMLQALNLKLRFPTHRDGLKAILSD